MTTFTDRKTMQFSGPEALYFIEQLDEELKNQNDRSLAVLAISGLDALLESILSKQLILPDNKSYKEIFDFNGPLGAFSFKVRMCAAMGLISKNEADEINRLNSIRNIMAHQIQATFSDNISDNPNDSIRSKCKNLKFCEPHYVPNVIPFAQLENGQKGVPTDFNNPNIVWPQLALKMPDSSISRSRFARSVSALTQILLIRLILVNDAPQPPSDFEYPEDLNSATADYIETLLSDTRDRIKRVEDLAADLEGLSGVAEDSQDGSDAKSQEIEDLLASISEGSHQLNIMLQMKRYIAELLRRSRAAQDSV